MKRAILALAAASTAAISACTSAPSGSSGGADLQTNNATGTVTTTLGEPLQRAHPDAVRAMQDLGYTVTDQPLDANKGVVKARTADGTKVEATLEQNGTTMSRLSVNAGITQSGLARTVARKIQERTH